MNRIKTTIKALLLAGLCLMIPVFAFAQSLTLAPAQTGSSIDYGMVALIGLRILLVLVLVSAAMVAFFNGHYWIFFEGNAKRAHEGKRRVALSLLIITMMFFALAVYKAFIPDYGVLAL